MIFVEESSCLSFYLVGRISIVMVNVYELRTRGHLQIQSRNGYFDFCIRKGEMLIDSS